MTDSGIPETCTHERRPGTTTCLYCLQERRARTSVRRRRALARFGLAFLGGAAALAVVIGAITALAPDSGSVSVSTAPAPVNQAGEADRQVGEPAATPRVVVQPTIARGTRDLGNGVVATRSSDAVVVSFDTDLLRTRFDWKFEAVVRSTLPEVYGELAREALDSVPAGQLVRDDLLEVLPERGIALPLGQRDTLMLWPMTRPGRDGPIVVAYRVAAH